MKIKKVHIYLSIFGYDNKFGEAVGFHNFKTFIIEVYWSFFLQLWTWRKKCLQHFRLDTIS